MASDGDIIDLDTALHWHLTANHYPPVNSVFIPVAKTAIEKGVEAVLADDYEILDEPVVLPNDMIKTYGELIEGLHLDSFIEQALAEDEEEE